MASWMIHLRVAQEICKKISLPIQHFILGNIAPDSGVPAPDGKTYLPDKDVSHFAVTDENGRMYNGEEDFINGYLLPALRSQKSAESMAFYIGYLAHLYADNEWIEHIYELGKTRLSDLRAQSKVLFAQRLKIDWYGLDFLFLQNNPDFEAYRIYKEMECMENHYVDFFAPDAFANRKAYILDFYAQGVATQLQADEFYLSPQELTSFVEATARGFWERYGELIERCEV